jgi:hypothetical protein
LAKEIAELKMQRDRWIWWAAGAMATFGWATGHADVLLSLVK